MHIFRAFNGPMPTTAAQAAVTTGTTIKTMLQIATPSTRQIKIISWGFTVATTPSSGTNQVELLQTDVAATVTAHVAAGVQPNDPNGPASLMTLGTSATGYTSTAEGTTTAARVFGQFTLAPTAGAYHSTYEKQFLPNEMPIVAVSKFLRVRADFDTAVNMVCWVCWDE